MRAAIRQVLFSQIPFTPRRLFANGEQGAWFDPSDFGSMFQDSAGTTPVTAIEQPVGLIFDKSERGNHASQSTTTSRPILRNLYNMLTRTEEFNTVGWSKSANCTIAATQYLSPINDETAEKIQVNSNGQASVVHGAVALQPNAQYTISVSFAPAGKGFAYMQINEAAGTILASTARINLSTGAIQTAAVAGGGLVNFSATATLQANGYYRLTAIFTTNAAHTQIQPYAGPCDSLSTSNTTASGTDGVYIWGASLVASNEASLPYQRVVTNTPGSGVYDTDTSKFVPYLFFDGTDDWLATGNIDFSATDKMSVFAGARKLSDSQQRIIAELSATIASNNGSFMLSGPNSAAANYNFSSKGTSQADNTVTAYAAPISNVITGLADIAAPTNIIRINQVATALNTSQGTGNYGNFPLYIGRRGGTTLPFSGRIYSLIIRGALTNSPQLEQTERWVAAKTGVTL